jgi:hypothetical protein
MNEVNEKDGLQTLTPEQIRDLLAKTDWKGENLPPQDGGVLTPTCLKCGGAVFPSGSGIIRETCSRCGEIHEEPLLKTAGA